VDHKVPDEKEKKNPTKRNPLLVAITLSWSTHIHYKDDLLILAVMQIQWRLRSSYLERIFVRKFVCFFCRCFWYSATELDRGSNVFTNQ